MLYLTMQSVGTHHLDEGMLYVVTCLITRKGYVVHIIPLLQVDVLSYSIHLLTL
jgi:hypothetical protein